MEQATEPVRLVRPTERRRRIPVAAIMALSFGTLVLLSVGGVLALTVGANYRNTYDLLGSRAALLVDAMEDSLRSHMNGAENLVDGVAALYAAGRFDIDDPAQMTAVLSGALTGTPNATALLIYTGDLRFRGVYRDDKTGTIEQAKIQPVTAPDVIAAMEERRKVDGRLWGSFVENDGGLYANVSVPLIRNGIRAGWIIAPIELSSLSGITRDLSARFETHAFILDGTDRVLADERLAGDHVPSDPVRPLAPLKGFGDPVLAHFAERKPLNDFASANAQNIEISEIEIPFGSAGIPFVRGDPVFIAITKPITGYGARPWTIGAYYGRRELGDEVVRAWLSAMVGLGALVVAVIAAVILGKWLARPVRAIADQAQRVAGFELDSVVPLPRSRVMELDDQAVAFNAMLTGLRAFSTYIPRSLVAKLVRTGDTEITQPRQALVTVMFTDIAGFTSLSERMDAHAAAELLNHHFAIMCQAIDAHGGTVDKFLGDGMMAFFGAPDRLKGHAAAAVRAAGAIREALAADNRTNLSEGRPALRVRIGIHSGPVIVGNIGAADRVNYTIIGDTVNVSQRLQELGKLVAPDAETAIVVSGETASRLDERVELTSTGKHRLRGRGEPIEVFLVGDIAISDARTGVAHGTGAA